MFVRAFLAKRRDRNQNQARVLATQFVIRSSQACARTRRKTLNDEIRFRRQPIKEFAPFVIFQIQSDAAFVCVAGKPVETLATAVSVLQEGRLSSRGITARWLDFYDICAEVTEDFPGQKTERSREIKNVIWSQ